MYYFATSACAQNCSGCCCCCPGSWSIWVTKPQWGGCAWHEIARRDGIHRVGLYALGGIDALQQMPTNVKSVPLAHAICSSIIGLRQIKSYNMPGHLAPHALCNPVMQRTPGACGTGLCTLAAFVCGGSNKTMQEPLSSALAPNETATHCLTLQPHHCHPCQTWP